MRYLIVSRINGGYRIKFDNHSINFYGYSKRNAIKAFREQEGLKHKHLTILEI